MFKSDSKSAVTDSDENSALILKTAGAVSPVNELNAVNRAALCKSASLVHVQRNDELKPEGANRWLMFLVDGSITLHNGKDEVGTITAGSKEALQPLFLDKAAYQLARTTAVAKVVKFGREQLDILSREQQKNAIKVVDVQVSEKDNLIFDSILAEMKSQKIRLASFRDVAAKILTTHERVVDIPVLADLIQTDPGLALSIVNEANKTDGGAGDSITSIRGAISRLGVETTQRNIGELLRKNTIIPANEVIDRRFRAYVERSTVSTALVQYLASDLPDLKAEIAILVALVADIGELQVITHANNMPELFETDADLDGVIERLRTILSSWLLSAMHYPEEFVLTADIARDWYRNHTGEICYADLVTASLLIIQSEMPSDLPSSIPSANNLLLARRLQQAGIDLSASADIMAAARNGGAAQPVRKAG